MEGIKKIEKTFTGSQIIKLGGSFAVSLPRKQVEEAGFVLGLPVDVTLRFDQSHLEEVEFFDEEIDSMERILKEWEKYSPREIVIFAKAHGFVGLEKGEDFVKYKAEIREEFKDILKFWKKETKEFEDSMNMTKEEVEDSLDYDTQGEDLIN